MGPRMAYSITHAVRSGVQPGCCYACRPVGCLNRLFGNARIRASDAQKKSNTLTHVVRVRYRCCNYYFYMLHSGHCIKHDVLQWEFFMFKSDIRVISIHIFFILQEMISDVATVIYYQCCAGLSDEKFLIGHPRDSSGNRT